MARVETHSERFSPTKREVWTVALPLAPNPTLRAVLIETKLNTLIALLSSLIVGNQRQQAGRPARAARRPIRFISEAVALNRRLLTFSHSICSLMNWLIFVWCSAKIDIWRKLSFTPRLRQSWIWVALTLYRPAVPFGNRINYFRGPLQFSIVTIEKISPLWKPEIQ